MLTGLIQSRNTRQEKRSTKSTPDNQENGTRNIYINNYFKCKWIKYSSQKTQTTEWIQKQDPYICFLQEIHFRPQDTY